MSFNSNSYMNYPYYQQNNPYMSSQSNNFMPQMSGLNGKIVESKDIVTVTEVPIGGYGVFPKADLTEIYVKTWDANSKQMNILSYKLEDKPELALPSVDTNVQILEKIAGLEQKIDQLCSTPKAAAAKKEVNNNAF